MKKVKVAFSIILMSIALTINVNSIGQSESGVTNSILNNAIPGGGCPTWCNLNDCPWFSSDIIMGEIWCCVSFSPLFPGKNCSHYIGLPPS